MVRHEHPAKRKKNIYAPRSRPGKIPADPVELVHAMPELPRSGDRIFRFPDHHTSGQIPAQPRLCKRNTKTKKAPDQTPYAASRPEYGSRNAVPASTTGLAYGQAGDGEDLLSEEQAKTRMRTKTLDKNVLFVGRRDATPVIGNNKVKTAGNLVPQYPLSALHVPRA